MKRSWIVWLLLTATPAVSQILPGGLGTRWWRAPQTVEKLGLTADQQKKMDEVFLQSQVALIDRTAALSKEETFLEPLLSADPPDAAKIRAQIARVADARAELEKANANMLLGLRLLLTSEQWRTLQSTATKPRPRLLEKDGSPSPKPRIVR